MPILADVPNHVSPIIAIIQVYNEEDILEPVLAHLANQNIATYIMDDWSTDDTLTIAKSFLNRGVIGIEHFPLDQPSPLHLYDLALVRKSALAQQLATKGARWIIHHDADEIRDSPWPGMNLHDGLLRVESEGFNAVDHVLLQFVPTNELWHRGLSPTDHFQHFEFLDTRANSRHVKAWIQGPEPADLATHSGHDIHFPNRRVHPLPFLLKHYSLRNSAQARKKIFQDRRPRYQPQMVQRGLHRHYDHITPDHSFLRSPDDPRIQRFDEGKLKRTLLAEKYAPMHSAAEIRILELETKLRLAEAEIARLQATQKQLRYQTADRINTTLKSLGLHQVVKKILPK